jgi:hypothetical protein
MALCHKAVREIAKEMAGASYEELAKEDAFYKRFPNQNLFIAKHWKNYLPFARHSLLQILGGDYPDAVKQDTFEIYLKDRELQQVESAPVIDTPPMGTA